MPDSPTLADSPAPPHRRAISPALIDGVARREVAAVAFGVAGVGGYGGLACDVLANHEDAGTPVTLAAACEVNRAAHADRIASMAARGVPVHDSFAALLDEPIDAVWLPIPIHLHAAFTAEAARAGKAVLCEKPAAGCIADVDAMIRARDAGGRPVAVGFQDVYTDEAAAMKRALVGGAIGTVTGATLVGCWPRDEAYYRRNAWSGRLTRDGRWVLDSPAQNALAHWLHLALYLLGGAARASASPASVESELYVAGPAEHYDTCALRVGLDGGATLLAYLTHACGRMRGPVLTIDGTRGRLTLDLVAQSGELVADGVATPVALPRDHHRQMIREFVRHVRGDADANVGTLEMARAHTVVTNAASEASIVRRIAAPFVEIRQGAAPGHAQAVIPGIDEIFFECARRRVMPHELGGVAWAMPAGRRDVRGYRHFAGPPTA